MINYERLLMFVFAFLIASLVSSLQCLGRSCRPWRLSFGVFLLFFFLCSGHHRDLHSFPTRRSSDLSSTSAPSRARCGPSARSASTGCTRWTGSARRRRRRTRRSPTTSARSPPRSTRSAGPSTSSARSEEHTSELQSQFHLVCRLLLE